ncbi:hypothetical protein [Paraburkholderia sp. UCT31]|nr:hypothetical protein [Paraburkholderia sp. UCT31]
MSLGPDQATGKIVDRTVEFGQFSAVALFREAVYQALGDLLPASY